MNNLVKLVCSYKNRHYKSEMRCATRSSGYQLFENKRDLEKKRLSVCEWMFPVSLVRRKRVIKMNHMPDTLELQFDWVKVFWLTNIFSESGFGRKWKVV